MKIGIIGGGITGLSVAALLGDRHDIVLWESSPRPGGVAAASELDGASFCPGPQFFWGFGPEGAGTRILGRMGLSVPMRELPLDFDQIGIGEGPFHTTSALNHGEPLNKLLRKDPGQAAPVARFLETLDHIGEACVSISSGARFMDSAASMLHRILISRELSVRARGVVLRNHRASVTDLARRVGLGAEALRIITFHQGIFAERLDELSVVLFAATRHHLKKPLYVPEGGTRRMSVALGEAASARGAQILLSERVTGVEPSASGWTVSSRRGGESTTRDVDRLVFACAPQIASRLLPAVKPRSEPGNCVTALCLSLDADSAVRGRLMDRTYSWYRTASEDVAFHPNPGTLDYVSFTSPTLNAVGPGAGSAEGPCVVVAFYPGGTEGRELAAAAEERVTTTLGQWGDCSVRARQLIGRRQWQAHFGSHAGAIYGRRMTYRSIKQSAITSLPHMVSLAHSSVGIPGIIGCLEMAERTADEIGHDSRNALRRSTYA